MKRNLSEMDSDCDDVFTEDSSKGAPTPGNESCQLLNRKRRRGIIEKRRRDRINHSLSELRRLVPAAFEKQGSAKLEKAEILQMAVDHLKMMHSKGFDALSFDPHKFALDYHSIGFRECASEVARYLVTIEGMDLQDPLRLRLMSHLQCYSAQRELSLKSAGVHNPWNPAGTFASVPPPTVNAGYSNMTSPHSNQSAGTEVQYSCSENRHNQQMDNGMAGRSMQTVQQQMGQHGGPLPPNMAPSSHMQPTSGIGPSGSMTTLGQMPPNQYHVTGHGFSSGGYVNQGQQGSSVKPYRPWGAELAY